MVNAPDMYNLIHYEVAKVAYELCRTQLVDFKLVILDIFKKLLICDICYPSGVFIECKTSVSAPCLASITKGSMRLKGLTQFDCGKQF